MQSYDWGSYKAALGWHVVRVAVTRQGRVVAGAQILLRRLPWLPWTMAYVPRGPLVNLEDTDVVQELFAAIHEAARARGALFLRVEPNLIDDASHGRAMRRHGFRRTTQTNQPRSTLWVDLRVGEEALFRGLRKKTRQYVRRGEDAGVEIFWGGDEHLPDLHRVVRVTSRLKGIGYRGRRFYDEAWRIFRTSGSVELALARHRGEIVAATMVFRFGGTCMHLFGGTTEQGRSVHASYLLQWSCLRRATRAGLQFVDLWGIPDEVATMSPAEHEAALPRNDELWGVYKFKRGFGGEVVSFLGTFDYVYRPSLYAAAMLATRGVSAEAMSGWLDRRP